MSGEGKTIGLLGGTGNTGKHFLQKAIDAGYVVRALVRTPSKVAAKSDNLTLVQGSFDDTDKIKEVIEGCDYVVCMAGSMGNPKKHPAGMFLGLVKALHPIMREAGVKVFLYQAGAFNPEPHKKNSKTFTIVRKTYGNLSGLEKPLKDHDKTMEYIADEMNKEGDPKYIITRPGGMEDGESKKKLGVVERANAGGYMYIDVAQFALEALPDESLYGTCPMVG